MPNSNDKVILAITNVTSSQLVVSPQVPTILVDNTNDSTNVLVATPVGLVGRQGETGPAGPTGPRGATGAQGIQGPVGPIGSLENVGNYVQLINGLSGSVGITGTLNQIGVSSSNKIITIGLPTDVTINGNLDVLGNINIVGKLSVDGLIITKTGFQGYTGNSDLETVDYVLLDGGEY
jgi:hypothetical protein